MIKCRSFEEVEVHIAALVAQNTQLGERVRLLEKQLDTHGSPLWKRALFRVDGWPPWYRVVTEPSWRPWRRWWKS